MRSHDNTTERRQRRVRRLTLAVAVAALMAPGSAAAQAPPGDIAGVDQYVELLPGAGGKKPTGARGDSATGEPIRLSSSAQRELRERGGSDAALLEAIATSPELGAPGDGLSRSTGTSDGRGTGSARGNGGDSDAPGAAEGVPDVSFGDAVGSAFGAIANPEGGGGGPSPLLLALLAISAAFVSTAVWRARRNRA